MAIARDQRVRSSAAPSAQVLSIQYLRALAALAVVAFHTLESTSTQLPVGAAGVDVFFVISGFIMWTVTKREATPQSFLWRRLVRVAPLYWIATAGIAAIYFVRPRFLWMPPVRLGDFVQSLLFIPHLDPWGRQFPTLMQGWTLNYEMFFYLVFAAVLLAPRSRQALLLTLVLAGLVLARFAVPAGSPLTDTYMSPLLLEFLAGVWVGRLWETGRLKGRALGGALVVAALAYFIWQAPMRYEQSLLRALFWGVPALALVTGCLCLEAERVVPNVGVAKTLGDSSYSLYLFHIPVIAALQRLLSGVPTPIYLAVSLVVCAGAGVALFYGLERPLNGSIRRLASIRVGAPRLKAAL